jgi:halogenation protein CepH
MKAEETFDVIVIGGGPAGSTLATFVKLMGHRVLLLEREQFPRHQIGESLLPPTVHGICRMLGVTDDLDKAKFVIKRGSAFRWGNKEDLWGFNFATSADTKQPFSYSYQVCRSKFDKILLENAARNGVDVRERHLVSVLLHERERVVGVRYSDSAGQERFARARYVADASGNTTRTARQIGDRIYSTFFRNVALYAYYKGGKRLPPPNDGATLSAAFSEGWFWYIPLSEMVTSVGAVIAVQHADAIFKKPEAAMERFIAACPIIKDYLSSAQRITAGELGEFRIRKDYSYSHSRFWSPGAVLIGDSACFIDPIFSSGVHLATYSALLAARSINTCLEQRLGEDACFGEFEKRYRREFGNFYQYNIAFYDMQKDVESYYWAARNILKTDEAGNEAFVRLVSGVAPEEFFAARRGLGSLWQSQANGSADAIRETGFDTSKFDVVSFLKGSVVEQHQIEGQAGIRPHENEKPLFEGGLVPSMDGFHWVEACMSQAV